jgi:hypothetical protein
MVDARLLNDDPVIEAQFAPIMAGRFYEGLHHTDGTDLGSRRRHREFMRLNGYTTLDDYSNGKDGQFERKAEERARAFRPGQTDKPEGHNEREIARDIQQSIHQLTSRRR